MYKCLLNVYNNSHTIQKFTIQKNKICNFCLKSKILNIEYCEILLQL